MAFRIRFFAIDQHRTCISDRASTDCRRGYILRGFANMFCEQSCRFDDRSIAGTNFQFLVPLFLFLR
ncbi:hypothetical protein BBJ41_38195 [Burkholderia stabilis]|nr:hypothetical protein BBJ41_38195 [Burkholderia stabilis]